MKIKHKLLSDYQYLTNDKKIFLIKSGTIIEDYNYKVKNENIYIDKGIVDANPEIFQIIDWKSEILSYMKVNKMPQPAQLAKKIIPFIEDMILSSMNQNSTVGQVMDEYQIKEIERKEVDLNNRESIIKDKEEEIDIRINRIEKREVDYKNDLLLLDKKEDEIRLRSKEITERVLDIEDKLQDLNEKERNFDRSVLESAGNLDIKYAELGLKIDQDMKVLSERERELEVLTKSIKMREVDLIQKESNLLDKIRDFEMKLEKFKLIEAENLKLDKEIKDWERMHWKFKRSIKPPSAE
jgi:hypothetical protein